METREEIIKEAKRVEEDSLYSSKGHFYAAQFWSRFHLFIGTFTSVMVAASGVFVLYQFDFYRIYVGGLAVLTSAISAISTFTSPSQRATEHRSAGNRYNSLRNRARFFSGIEAGSEEYEKSLEKLRCLCIERDDLNSRSLQIPRWAFNRARKGVEEGEAKYEIDPPTLKYNEALLGRRVHENGKGGKRQ